MALLERHLAFIEALREAGVPVSLAEDLDAVVAVEEVGLRDRESLRAGLAATLLKRQTHRGSFDAIFDLYFPALLGSGWQGGALDGSRGEDGRDDTRDDGGDGGPDDDLAELRQAMAEVGIDTSAGSVRSTRSALRREGARES